jgi:hypothetical protein
MRLHLLIVTTFASLALGSVTVEQQIGLPRGAQNGDRIPVPDTVKAIQPVNETLEVESAIFHPGLPLAESAQGVYRIYLMAEVDNESAHRGSLVLEPNAPTYDEFGFRTMNGNLPQVKLECSLKLVKKRRLLMPAESRLGAPEVAVEWRRFEIRGPKITSRLSLAVARGEFGRHHGRLLVHDKDGKVHYAVDVQTPLPLEPCHPGCFPAGTAIDVPSGKKSIERIGEGDVVTTMNPDGKRLQGKVSSVFVTKNRLFEIRTDAGSLLTTRTQPISLAGGKLKTAGELNAGDQIYRWTGGERRTVTVNSVSATGREERVYNLILGDPAIFVANGFLVRSKPPAPVAPVRTEGVVP